MKKKIISIISVVLCLALVLCACDGKNGRLSAVTDDDKTLNEAIVMTVGDEKITQADFNFIYKLVYDNMSQYAMYYGEDWENMEIEEGKKMSDFMYENTVDQLKQMAAAVKLAVKYDIKDDKDVQKTVTEQKNSIINDNYKGVDKYKEYLLSAHTTDKAFDRYLVVCEIYQKLYKELTKVGGELRDNDDEIEKQFLEEYKDKWRVQHILISTEGGNGDSEEDKPARTEEEAKALAEEVIKKLDEGSDFDELIEQYNEDPGISKGKFYVFGTGEMVSEFEEASKNLEIGAYTKEPVKTSYGYHIIKRYDINTKIDEFKDFQNNLLQEKTMKKLDDALKDMDVDVKEDTIKKYLDKWAEERKKEAEEAAKSAEQENAGSAEKAEDESSDKAAEASEEEK